MPFPPNYHGFDESLLEGLRFNATLQLRTPLEVLLHHGEMFIGSIEDAPKYGFWNGSYSPHGIWLPETKALGQLAIEQGGNIELATKLDELNQEL